MNDFYQDPTYWGGKFRCYLGHKNCSAEPYGECAGEAMVFNLREYEEPSDNELNAIINDIRRDYLVEGDE